MEEMLRGFQDLILEIDRSIKRHEDEQLTLKAISAKFGYSEYYTSRKFKELSGMSLRDYLRGRRLAFALRELRDTERTVLDIALDYGFSSNEAFTRAFHEAYGLSPAAYRRSPAPAVLRTVIRPFDCYLARADAPDKAPAGEIKTYFVTIPAHRFLHVRNYESIGYFDFWEKQSAVPGQDCETVCGLLSSIKGGLDDLGDDDLSSGSGQLMAWLNHPEGRICSWGIPLAECYGIRLPADWSGAVPEGMILSDVPEGDYIVFEHGPFDYETQSASVEAAIEQAMKEFDYERSGYALDLSPGRFFYYFHDPKRNWKYVRPVVKK